MSSKMDLIHKLLDGGLSPEDEKTILDQVETDPLLKDEYGLLSRAVHLAETCEKMPVPAGFAEKVMKRLPPQKHSAASRLRDFFFGERVFRWNMAAAVAAACFMIFVVGGILQLQKRNDIVIAQKTPVLEQAKTVKVSFYAPRAKTVSVAGDFNKWSVNEGAMKRRDDGSWILGLPLKPGVYHYMFVVDGEGWVADPKAEAYRDDGFGNKNAVLRVNNI